MSAGAGALNLQLGGAAMYHGVVEQRPQLGIGRHATAADIDRALRLVQRTTLLWVSIYLIIEVWRA
jgi:adenosylcobinamide-phosphate synthase